jgi:hypothetical protein
MKEVKGIRHGGGGAYFLTPDAAVPAAPSRLATSSTRAAMTAATAETGGTWLPTSSPEEGTAVDVAADAAALAAAATSKCLQSNIADHFCDCFFFHFRDLISSFVYI